MADFNPDAYLAQKTAPVSSGPQGFDPSQYLKEKTANASPSMLDQLSDAASSVGKGALQAVGAVGKKIDSYTGAPVRAAIGAAQNGEGLMGSLAAAKNQFGQNSDLAPTGKDIATKAGLDATTPLSQRIPWAFTDKPGLTLQAKKGGLLDVTPAGAAGLGIDLAADPLMLAGGAAKEVPALAEAASSAKDLGLGAFAKVGEAVTGVPKAQIKTYVNNLKEINQNISKYGEDLASASDDVRAKFATDITRTRQNLNNKISDALKEASPEATIDATPVLDKLSTAIDKLNPKFDGDQIEHLKELRNVVDNATDEAGRVNLKDAFDLKTYLQNAAQPSYQKTGQIFIPGDKAARAAKDAASVARKALNDASPDIAEANNQLSLMHDIESKINKNLIAPGKPESALMGAGTSPGNRNSKNLERLGNLTGTDMTGDAEKLAAQRTFTSPPILPMDTTGKTATRTAIGSGAGWLLSHNPAGAAIGAAVTSPATLKGLINAGAITIPQAQKLYPGLMGIARSQNQGQAR